MGVEDLCELFADTTAGASDDEDLAMSICDAQWQREWMYLSSLVWDGLLIELSCWREGLAELVTHFAVVTGDMAGADEGICTVFGRGGMFGTLCRSWFST